MTRRVMLLAAVTVLLAAVVVLNWRIRQERTAVEMSLVAAREAHAKVLGKLSVLEARLARAEDERQRLKRAALATPKTAVATDLKAAKADVSAQSREPLTVSDLFKRSQEEGTRPEAQVRTLASRRAGLAERFAPFYRRAGLTSPEVRAFEEVWMRREERQSDLIAAAQSQGLSLRDSPVGKLFGEIHADYQQAQRELLGEAKYRELQTFERTTGAWDMARHFAAAATVRGLSFSSEQMDRFVGTVAAASSSYAKGQSVVASDVDWAAALDGMRGFLTEAQLAFVRNSEPPGGGIFGARWNGELNKATRAAKAASARPTGG